MPASTSKRDSDGQKKLLCLRHLGFLAASLLGIGEVILPNLTVAQMQKSSVSLRDPDAVAMINSSLNAMGGTAAWLPLRTAITTGTLTAPNKASASAFTWTDDWSTGIKMRRDNTKEDGSHKLFVQGDAATLPSSTQSVSNPASSGFHAPRFDSLTALILHLPGAALSVVLQDTRYATSTVHPPVLGYFQGAPHSVNLSTADLSNTSCVRIMRSPKGSDDSAADVTLCFSSASSLPVYARVMQPNLLDPSKPLPETAQYSGFQKMGPVLVPVAVSIIDPINRHKVITINSVSWNSSLSGEVSSGVSQ